MLPHAERKALASQYGYHSIGDFEEYVTLRRAVGETTMEEPYENARIYETEKEHTLAPILETKKSAIEEEEDESEGDAEDDLSSNVETEALDEEELVKRAGMILLLPEELIHKLLEWLPIDIYATLALVSPHWKYLTRTEAVYKRLCERCYLNQSKRRVLNTSRFGHSYRAMLEKRPRVRAGGGLYVMKYSTIKKPQRDMWTEIPHGAILETVYYRYLYFQENGTVLYALTNDPPHEMIVRFWKMMATAHPDKQAVWGRYQVAKHKVTVIAKQAWQVVRLEMSIQPESIYGKFAELKFDRHTSSSDGSFDDYSPPNVVEYKVPNEVFRFIKNKRL
jgi:F-box protein 9